jgi:hypothetical protein
VPRNTTVETSEMAILRQVVDSSEPVLSADATRAPSISLQRSGQTTNQLTRCQEPPGYAHASGQSRAEQLHPRQPDSGDPVIEGLAIIEGDPCVAVRCRMNQALLGRVRRLAGDQCEYCRIVWTSRKKSLSTGPWTGAGSASITSHRITPGRV